MNNSSTSRQMTNLRSIIVAGVLATAGIALMVVGQFVLIGSQLSVVAFVSQLGGLLVATGLVTVGWELLGRRSFTREVMDVAGVGHDLEQAGILRVDNHYLASRIWDDLFEKATTLDILVAYAATWRNAHQAQLIKLATKPKSRIRVYLPDPDDDQIMATLSNRFGYSKGDLCSKVNEAAKFFDDLKVGSKAVIEVYFHKNDLLFSAYQFGQHAVITLYSHTRTRNTEVPTFVVREGQLLVFVQAEINAIQQSSRRYVPSPQRVQP